MAAWNNQYAKISEEAFTNQVICIARWLGWRIMHQRPARTQTGWRTAISGHAGFPDLFMLRDHRCIMAELKSAKGKTTPEQDKWLEAAKNAGFETYIWRPADIDQIEKILKGGAK